jgi:hypothetical protein
VPALAQRVVEQRDHAVLQIRGQVDQQVAAGDQVQLRERGVLQQVVNREQADLTQVVDDAVGAVLALEVPLQPLGGDILGNAGRIAADAGDLQRVLVDVAGEDLQPGRAVRFRHALAQQHRDRVGLLARGAGRHPYAHRVVGALAFEQLRDHLPLQRLEGRRVAEEVGDADQQVLEQQVDFLGVPPQTLDEVGHFLDLQHLHAALNPADDGLVLVVLEIVAGPRAQQREDLHQVIDGLAPAVAAALAAELVQMPEIFGQLLRHGFRRQREVHQPGGQRAPHHPVILGLGLGQRQAAILLHGAKPERAVAAGTGQDHAGGILALVFGQRFEEGIDRRPLRPRFRHRREVQARAVDGQRDVGGDDVHGAGLDGPPILGPLDRNRTEPLQDVGEVARPVGVEMLDQDEGKRAVLGDGRQELLQRIDAAGRGADADDRVLRCRLSAREISFVRVAHYCPSSSPARPCGIGARRRSIRRRRISASSS